MTQTISFGYGTKPAQLLSNKLNRHGVIAGATGTGKTVTLKVLAEQLSEAGVPVLLSDIKGDLASLAEKGEITEKIAERLKKVHVEDFEPSSYPVAFWDIFGENGINIRTTISEMGPILLSQLLGLNETQEGILNIAFKVADEQGLLLIDIKDLRAMLNYVGAHASELRNLYGNIAQQSIGTILRSLLVLEQQGGNQFFGEPAFEIGDLFKTDASGRGNINVLSSEKLFQTPKLYATFLLWFLSELYENLPEVGDLDKPKLVFFFDEAHVLFNQSNPAVQAKIELIVRLIRSKGISIFFVTQNPTDIPNAVASQLGNRIQHGLRAFTPAEQKNVKAVAETFRQEEGKDLVSVITNLKVGDAVVSTLQEDGSPSFAEVVSIYPPKSKLDAVDAFVRQQLVNQSPFYDKYAEMFDRESAHEQLLALEQQFQQEQEEVLAQREAEKQAEAERKEAEKQEALAQKEAEKQAKLEEKERERQERELERQARQAATKKGDSAMDRFTKNIMSSVGREVGRVITRGVMGLFKK
ncbi:helicase HerA-like domain-containing protein [uncultured Granulicatella sp.]|uniref:helicase HerA-like domain-containing protein n=1 Tax=uncultured Granulicatella sp. TaxID=316089 RepID=UPI0026167F8A|nr:helicase HerA-like domain-containing protein [uncultured Granulicatella sp.]